MKLSLCMIVKNEEEVLARCLDSVKALVDEVIIVDTGSTDQTMRVASTFTDQVYPFAWTDDFSAARNFSFSKATGDYIMWLDADDVFIKTDQLLFRECREALSPTVSVVMMKYNTGFDENGNVTYSYYRERILKNDPALRWQGRVHEAITPIGQVVYWDVAVTHHKLHPSDSDRNLRIFERQMREGIALNPREQFYYGRELYYHKRYREALDVLESFLSSGDGWLENKIDACCHCAYCRYELGEDENALCALLRSFAYDLPRAEVLCEIGNHFLKKEQYAQAAYWYTLAPGCKRDDQRGGFTAPDCYGYLPCIQLCVCYSCMGKLEQAIRFNELAASYKPQSAAVAHNRAYFQSLTAAEQAACDSSKT